MNKLLTSSFVPSSEHAEVAKHEDTDSTMWICMEND